MSWKATKWWKRFLDGICGDDGGSDNFKGIEELTRAEPGAYGPDDNLKYVKA